MKVSPRFFSCFSSSAVNLEPLHPLNYPVFNKDYTWQNRTWESFRNVSYFGVKPNYNYQIVPEQSRNKAL